MLFGSVNILLQMSMAAVALIIGVIAVSDLSRKVKRMEAE